MRFRTASVLTAALAMAWPGLAPSATAPAAAATVPTKVVETQAAMRDLWLGHIEQIKQLAAGQYEQEAATWAGMTPHTYVIADALAGGIAKQFPEKFR